MAPVGKKVRRAHDKYNHVLLCVPNLLQAFLNVERLSSSYQHK